MKHVKNPIVDKFEDEFMFKFDQLTDPLTTENNTIIIALEESGGLVSHGGGVELRGEESGGLVSHGGRG